MTVTSDESSKNIKEEEEKKKKKKHSLESRQGKAGDRFHVTHEIFSSSLNIFVIGDTIHTHQEIQCLLYAGFLFV